MLSSKFANVTLDFARCLKESDLMAEVWSGSRFLKTLQSSATEFDESTLKACATVDRRA